MSGVLILLMIRNIITHTLFNYIKKTPPGKDFPVALLIFIFQVFQKYLYIV